MYQVKLFTLYYSALIILISLLCVYVKIGKVNLSEEEVKMQFDKCVDEYIEGNDIDDEQREIISSINSFINEEDQEEQYSG